MLDLEKMFREIGNMDTIRYCCDADLLHRNDVRADILLEELQKRHAQLIEDEVRF